MNPSRVGDLGGVFVLARLAADSIRLVSSTDFVFTLRRAGTAFATRAVAAMTLGGVRSTVDADAACEFLGLYSVIGTGELLTGVEACEEGTVVDVTTSGTRQHVAVPLRNGCSPVHRRQPAAFRAVLGSWLTRARAVPEAALALTAGRDSGLVASCLAADGGQLLTVTHTVPGFPDNRGAAAVARTTAGRTKRCGSPPGRPDVAAVDPSGGPRPGDDVVQYLTRQAVWCEGMQHPRDALVGHFTRPAGGIPTITGHGGETGRAYFWKNLPNGPDIDSFIDEGGGWHLPPRAKDRLRATVEGEAALAADLGWPGAGLDLLYPRRQRSWLDHSGLADAPFTDLMPAFLTAEMTALMLDIPQEDRRTGSLFDAALALDPPTLDASRCEPRGRRHGPRGWAGSTPTRCPTTSIS